MLGFEFPLCFKNIKFSSKVKSCHDLFMSNLTKSQTSKDINLNLFLVLLVTKQLSCPGRPNVPNLLENQFESSS